MILNIGIIVCNTKKLYGNKHMAIKWWKKSVVWMDGLGMWKRYKTNSVLKLGT